MARWQWAFYGSTAEVERLVASLNGASSRESRLRKALPARPPLAAAHGAYAITGGLGGLGLRAALWLAQGCATKVLLTSRGGCSSALPLAVEKVARVLSCDSSDSEA